MTLLENEVILDSLASVQLTNYRITKEYGKSYKLSIFLEKISSIEAAYKSKPYLILIGILLIIIGLYLANDNIQEFGIFSVIVGIVLIIAYFRTRKNILRVSPDGGTNLDLAVKGVSNERVEEFITNIQRAKQEKK